MFPTPEQEAAILKDADALGANADTFNAYLGGIATDCECHIRALLPEVHRLRGVLQRIACERNNAMDDQGIDYLDGYMAGQNRMGKIAREGLE